MRLALLMSLLSFCLFSPLLADTKDNKYKFKVDPLPPGWTGNEMQGTFLAMDEEINIIQLNWSTGQDDFKRWCEVIKDREDGAAGGWTDYKSEPLKPGPDGTMTFDRTGKRGDDAMHGRVYMLQKDKVFCWLRCSSTAATWDKNKPVFDEMAKHVK